MSAAGAPPGPETLPKPGPAGPVVPGRRDDERVEGERPAGGPRERPVGEGGERLDHADERDPGGVVRVAVVVRVDRALEPGDQLVGARVDRPRRPSASRCQPATRIGKTSRAGRDAREAGRPAGADEDPGELRAVALELERIVRAGRRQRRSRPPSTTSIPSWTRPRRYGLRAVDAGVEQRDRDAAPVEARQRRLRPPAHARPERPALEHARGDGGRVGGAHRVDALDLRRALEQRDARGSSAAAKPFRTRT